MDKNDYNKFEVQCRGEGVTGIGCLVYIPVFLPKKIPKNKDPFNEPPYCAYCSALEIKSLHDENNDIKSTVKDLKNDVIQLKKECATLKKKTSEQSSATKEVQNDVKNIIQSRTFEKKRSSIVVHGIEPGSSDDAKENYSRDLCIVRAMLKKLKVNELAINYVYRTRTGNRPLIVGINSQVAKDVITRRSFELNGITFESENEEFSAIAKPDRTPEDRECRKEMFSMKKTQTKTKMILIAQQSPLKTMSKSLLPEARRNFEKENRNSCKNSVNLSSPGPIESNLSAPVELSTSDLSDQNPVNNRRLSFALINARSIVNKIDEIRETIFKPKKYDFVLVTESWSRAPLNDAFFTFSGYHPPLGKDNQASKAGGVLLYVIETLPAPNQLFFNSLHTADYAACQVQLTEYNWVKVILIYRSPNSLKPIQNSIIDFLRKDISYDDFGKLIIAGDFNYPEIDWIHETASSKARANEKQFFEAVRDAYLIQHVKEPTRHTNILDLVLTTCEDDIIMLPNAPPLSNSDHDIVQFQKAVDASDIPPKTRLNLDQGNYNEIRKLAALRLLNYCHENDGAGDIFNIYKHTMLELQEEYIPKVNVNNRKPPDRKLTNLQKRKDHDHKVWKWRINNLGPTHQSTLIAKRRITESTNKVTSHVQDKTRKAEERIVKEKNPKKFYAFINRRLKTRCKVGPIKEEGIVHYKDEKVGSLLKSQFASVYTVENLEDMPEPTTRTLLTEPLTDIKVEYSTVLKILKSLNPNKSTGPDGITSRIIKETAEIAAPIITELIQKSISTGEIPDDWKEAIITPILKKAPKEDKRNHRPISLTSIICKVCETILKEKIIEHMEINDLFSSSQHGGLRNRGIVSQLLEALENWTDNLDHGVQTDVLYFDFEKAFDRIPHQRLLKKLNSYGIRGNVLNWIKNYLDNRTQKVRLNETLSDPFPVTSGAPQGTVLGCLLFLIYINDLPDVINATAKIFVDDLKIYKAIRSPADQDDLQDSCTAIDAWQDTWQLPLNYSKIEHLTINKQIDHTYTIHGVPIKKVDKVKDLGVTINHDLKQKEHIDNITKKAQGILYQINWSFKYIDTFSKINLYKSYVRPHLESACPTWNPYYDNDIQSLERIQQRATRTGFLQDLPYPTRLKRLGLTTLLYRRIRYDIIFLWKIKDSPQQLRHLNLTFDSSSRTRSNTKKIKRITCKKNLLQRTNFFSVRIVPVWNKLSEQCVSATKLETFKTLLGKEMPNIINPHEIENNNTLFPHHINRFLQS